MHIIAIIFIIFQILALITYILILNRKRKRSDGELYICKNSDDTYNLYLTISKTEKELSKEDFAYFSVVVKK